MAARERRKPGWRMILLLAALTAMHATYRWVIAGPRDKDAVLVSDLLPGATVPVLRVEVATRSGWDTGPLLEHPDCQIVVAFDPACPFCSKAARTESSRPPEERLPTTWVTDGDATGAMQYRQQLGDETRVVRSDEAIEALEVKGVPAGFLLDANGTIRRVWPYLGDESREELESRCREGAEGGAATEVAAATTAASPETIIERR